MKLLKKISLFSLLPLSAFGWDGWKLTAPPVGGSLVADGSAFSFAFDYRYRKNDDLFNRYSRVENPTKASTEFNQFLLTASYRMSSTWLFSTQIPFTDATRRERDKPDINMNGLGDITMSATYLPRADENSIWSRLRLSAGLILPTGKPRDNPALGEVAPTVFQLGTGTTQLALGANYFATLNNDWSFFSGANITFALYESSKGFHPAEAYAFRVGISRSITENLNLRLSLDFSHGEKDKFQGNEIGYTGSTVLSLTPSLIYTINDNFSASASILIPAYRRVNETALAVGPLWSLGLSYSF